MDRFENGSGGQKANVYFKYRTIAAHISRGKDRPEDKQALILRALLAG
jgi:hypothetical protein